MDTFAILLRSYYKSHQNPLNKILHYIGVPCVLFSLLIFFSWIHISMNGVFDIQTTWLFVAAMFIYYVRLDTQFALITAGCLLPLILLANAISSYWVSFFVFCLFFAGGWIMKLVGHFIEGEPPAFLANPKILLISPLFVVAEMSFKRKYRLELQAEIEAK